MSEKQSRLKLRIVEFIIDTLQQAKQKWLSLKKLMQLYFEQQMHIQAHTDTKENVENIVKSIVNRIIKTGYGDFKLTQALVNKCLYIQIPQNAKTLIKEKRFNLDHVLCRLINNVINGPFDSSRIVRTYYVLPEVVVQEVEVAEAPATAVTAASNKSKKSIIENTVNNNDENDMKICENDAINNDNIEQENNNDNDKIKITQPQPLLSSSTSSKASAASTTDLQTQYLLPTTTTLARSSSSSSSSSGHYLGGYMNPYVHSFTNQPITTTTTTPVAGIIQSQPSSSSSVHNHINNNNNNNQFLQSQYLDQTSASTFYSAPSSTFGTSSYADILGYSPFTTTPSVQSTTTTTTTASHQQHLLNLAEMLFDDCLLQHMLSGHWIPGRIVEAHVHGNLNQWIRGYDFNFIHSQLFHVNTFHFHIMRAASVIYKARGLQLHVQQYTNHELQFKFTSIHASTSTSTSQTGIESGDQPKPKPQPKRVYKRRIALDMDGNPKPKRAYKRRKPLTIETNIMTAETTSSPVHSEIMCSSQDTFDAMEAMHALSNQSSPVH